jgi:L-aspartate oxidase
VWRFAGIVRNAAGLETGLRLLNEIPDARPARNLLTVAKIIHEAAIVHAESRGAHYRDDFPVPADLAPHSYTRKDQPVILR